MTKLEKSQEKYQKVQSTQSMYDGYLTNQFSDSISLSEDYGDWSTYKLDFDIVECYPFSNNLMTIGIVINQISSEDTKSYLDYYPERKTKIINLIKRKMGSDLKKTKKGKVVFFEFNNIYVDKITFNTNGKK